MRVLRSNPGWVLLVIMPLLGGCIIELGAGHDQSAGGDSPPSGGGGSGGEGATGLTGAQQARKDEADRYVAQVIYKGATVTQSLQLASGEIVDGLDRSTFPDLPSPLPPLPFLPPDVTLPPALGHLFRGRAVSEPTGTHGQHLCEQRHACSYNPRARQAS
jgi:hypothetical protein